MDGVQRPAPGWYPTDGGTQRYWDGEQWTDHTAPAGIAPPAASGGMSDANWILIAHLSPLILAVTGFFGFLGPLVVWLIKKDQSEPVAYHAKEALNFQLTMLLAAFVSIIFAIILIGFVMLLVLAVVYFVVPILAAIRAGEGARYRYPATIRFVK